MEVWRPVRGWEGVYSVSDAGRIRYEQHRGGTYNRRAGDMATPCVGVDGYLFVGLSRVGEREDRATVQVHRIVCEAFHGAPPAGREQVNHKNGCRTDNAAGNLEWVSPLENTRHAIDILGRDPAAGARLDAVAALAIRIEASKGVSFRALARRYGVTPVTISDVARGKTWQHVGGPRAGSRGPAR
jgi:parvulin-like peptidyl-prolyl isomerase